MNQCLLIVLASTIPLGHESSSSIKGSRGYEIDDGSHSVIQRYNPDTGRAVQWNIERGSSTILYLPKGLTKEKQK